GCIFRRGAHGRASMADMATLAGLVCHRHCDLLLLRRPPQQSRAAAARLGEQISHGCSGSTSPSRTPTYAALEVQLLSPNPRDGLAGPKPRSVSVCLRNVSLPAVSIKLRRAAAISDNERSITRRISRSLALNCLRS